MNVNMNMFKFLVRIIDSCLVFWNEWDKWEWGNYEKVRLKIVIFLCVLVWWKCFEMKMYVGMVEEYLFCVGLDILIWIRFILYYNRYWK